MADPLSVTASIITVVGAADSVAKGLRRLKAAKDAPEGLQDLVLEVAQLEMVLNSVKSAVLSSGSPSIELATLIEEAGSKLLELRSLIEYTLTKAGVSDKVDRWQWLRKGNEVERLRNQLGTIRPNLVALTSSANFGVLQRVSIVTQDLSSEQQRLNAQMTSVLPRQEALLSQLCQRIEESQATQAAMMRLLGNFRQIDVNTASDDGAALLESLESPAVTPMIARPRTRSRREFHIQNLQIQSSCPVTCTCNCHQTWKIYSPWRLRKLFGYSKIEGAGLPCFRGGCNLRSCKGKRATFVHVNFFLPAVMASRMISLRFTSSPLYGPELLLRIPRVLHTDTNAYTSILYGELDDVKRSISAGEFKPWDVDDRGQSLITVAVACENFTIALYLAQVASDNYECLREHLHWFNGLSLSYFQYFLYRPCPGITLLSALIMNLKLVKRYERSRLELDSVPGLDWNELLDMNGFSELHKIVYGVSSRPLHAEIAARPEDLDRPDNVGLTPLWYACCSGNSNHVRILIQYGADVNSSSMPLICAAVWSGSYDSVEELLNTGALITAGLVKKTLYLMTIYYLNSLGQEYMNEVLAIDKALFGRLIDFDYRPSGVQPGSPLVDLIWPTSPISHARIRQLLELGANIELVDEEGLTPLCHAICENNTEACKILGRAGANANFHTGTEHTILHLAIRNATDANIIQAVSELDLSGVEIGAKDGSSCTAFELLKIRARRQRDGRYFFPRLYPYGSWDDFKDYHGKYCVKDIDTELQILLAFQDLLQQVQEAQRIPIEDRYPLLNLTRESLMLDQNEDSSPKTIAPFVPGAWPEN